MLTDSIIVKITWQAMRHNIAGARVVLRKIPLTCFAILLAVIVSALWVWETASGWYWRPIVFEALFATAIMLPKLLQRVSLRSLLLVPIGAISALAMYHAWNFINLESLFPLTLWLRPFSLMLMVGLYDWLSVPYRSNRRLFLLCTALATGAAIFAIVHGSLNYSETRVTIGDTTMGLAYRMLWPLLIIVTWSAIPASKAIATRFHRISGSKCAFVAGLSIAVVWAYFGPFATVPANWSLRGNGPFSRNYGVLFLDEHNSDSNRDRIWQAVEEADWKVKPTLDFDRRDYRQLCIVILENREGARAAEKLADQLSAKPSYMLAEYSARVFSKHQLVRISPVLLKYALLDSEPCCSALVDLDIPQAALAVLQIERHHMQMGDDFASRSSLGISDRPLADACQKTLAKLLGPCDGVSYNDWAAQYDLVIDQRSEHLPKETNEQLNRTVVLFLNHWLETRNANRVTILRGSRQARLDALAAGRVNLAGQLQSFSERYKTAVINGDQYLPEWQAVIYPAGQLELWNNAVNRFKEARPDYDAPTLQLLEQRFDEFQERIERIYDEEFPGALEEPLRQRPLRAI
ncbi:MAG: hypothetical protein JSS27_07415 [Planctomycetes bacterium]|nr:hypothetical protein [Planctomycetota bacterium]